MSSRSGRHWPEHAPASPGDEGRALSQRFVITGAPGSGKTPIIEHLRTLGFAGVDEPARAVLAEQRATGGAAIYDSDPQRFIDLMLARAIDDFEAAAGSVRVVFFDRGVPDHVGYAELFGLDTAAAWDAARTYRYNDAVFVLPSWPEIYTTDADRRMTLEQAAAFGDRVREIYVELGYTIVDVPTGEVTRRASLIQERVGTSSTRRVSG